MISGISLNRIARFHARQAAAFIARGHHLSPWRLAGATFAYLCSRFFSVLAFILPLKAILMLAQDGVPWYLSGITTAETKDTLVLMIAMAAIASYGLHLLSDKLQVAMVEKGAEQIVGRGGKLRLFNNQVDFAQRGFRHLGEIVGSVVILGVVMLAGLYINFLLFGSFALLLVAEYVLLYLLLRTDYSLSVSVRTAVENRLAPTMGLIGTWNFLIGFVILFVEFLAMEQRNIIVAILSVILLRQLTQQINKCVTSVVWLSRNHNQLNALFYATVPYAPVTKPFSYLRTLSGPGRNRLLSTGLGDVLGEIVQDVTSTWIDAEVPGVAYFETKVPYDPDRGRAKHSDTSRFFVKCYDSSKSLRAEHEVHLFEGMGQNIPGAPDFIGTTLVDDIRVLVFAGLPESRVSRGEWQEVGFIGLSRLWSTEPAEDLVRAYLRTHATISMRLGPERFAQMQAAVEGRQDRDVLSRLKESWGEIKSEVEQTALAIDNPGMNYSNCRWDADGNIQCLSWSQWRIEPVGCNHWFAGCDPEEIRTMIHKAAEHDVPMRASCEQVWLASRLFMLEKALNGTRFREAMDAAEGALEAMEARAAVQRSAYIGQTGT